MPVVSAEKLMEIAEGLLLAAGASQEEAKSSPNTISAPTWSAMTATGSS